MDLNSIMKSDVLDIIFEGRNKGYGAYDLRKTYESRIRRAVIIGGLCFLGVFSLPLLLQAVRALIPEPKVAEVKLTKIELPPPLNIHCIRNVLWL